MHVNSTLQALVQQLVKCYTQRAQSYVRHMLLAAQRHDSWQVGKAVKASYTFTLDPY